MGAGNAVGGAPVAPIPPITSRRCGGDGCTIPVSAGREFCSHCWALVGENTKAALYAATHQGDGEAREEALARAWTEIRDAKRAAGKMMALSGNTFPVRAQLAALGGVWDGRRWRVPESRLTEARDLVAGATRTIARTITGGRRT